MGNTLTARRPGKQGGIRKDTDPYSGERLAEIVTANESDLDEVYRSAAKAQVAWAARHQEIADWIIRESGGTRAEAELEWQLVHSVILESASFPFRVQGQFSPSM
jgi:aldehyde dehydrogenase (NAD+)